MYEKHLLATCQPSDRAIEALKELDEDGALAVLKQFNDSNLQVREAMCTLWCITKTI